MPFTATTSARSSLTTDRYAEARPYLATAIQLRPDLVDAYIVLALSHFKSGQDGEARDVAAKGLQVARPLLPPEAVRSIEQVLAPILRSSRRFNSIGRIAASRLTASGPAKAGHYVRVALSIVLCRSSIPRAP